MLDFPQFDYNIKQVVQAGQMLAGNLLWTEESAEAIREAFKIANNWRDSHALPMRKVRYELLGQIRKCKIKGVTAARLKRMQSIRRKLKKSSLRLNQMQDLAGCRAILPSLEAVNLLISTLRENSNHMLYSESDYINKPKKDGYRSHHMMFRFHGIREEEIYNGRRIEIQIRSQLQHAWATAVEAVGMFRNEDLKSGQGNYEWLRLFKLMSEEFAFTEGCILSENDQMRRERVAEISSLNDTLKAVDTLENLSHAVKYTESYLLDRYSKPKYYLIRYDNSNSTVQIQPYIQPLLGVRSYDNAEYTDTESKNSSINTVLVEVDKVQNLREAYPNYFGDVQLFKQNLKQSLKGKEAKEYAMSPQVRVLPKPKQIPDLSWFKQRRRWK